MQSPCHKRIASRKIIIPRLPEESSFLWNNPPTRDILNRDFLPNKQAPRGRALAWIRWVRHPIGYMINLVGEHGLIKAVFFI
jgi:hypothetical protein